MDPYKATSSEYVEPSMLEPMEGRDGAGYAPLCVALHWIMTGSGSIRVRLDDATAWASAVAKLRPLLAGGDVEVIGLPGTGRLAEVIPSTTFAVIKVLPPLRSPIADILLSSPSHIDCSCYLGEENWTKHCNDRLYVTGKPGPAWTHLQVRKSEILRRWPRPEATVRSETACMQWLADRMRQNPTARPKSKTAFWNEACQQFAGLGRRQFGRAWDRAIGMTGATGWSKAGRPKGSP